MKQTKNMAPDARVPLVEKLAYAVGGQGSALYSAIVASFLLPYYTNVAGISAGTVATVIGISKLLDGFSDLAAGYLIDHTHTKQGKCRPWLLRMIVPTVICMFLMLNVPAGFSAGAKLVYVFVTYNLVNTVCATIYGVANSALNGSMSMNQQDRGLNGGLVMLFGIVSGLVMNSTVLQICTAVGGGDPYTQRGWNVMLTVYTVAFVLLTLVCYFFTNERVTLAQWNDNTVGIKEQEKMKGKDGTSSGQREQPNPFQALKILIRDKYWVIFVITMICVLFMSTSNGMVNIYYAQYVLDDLLLYTPLANFSSIGALITIFATLALMTKFKKRNIALSGFLLVCIGSLLPAFSRNMNLLCAANAMRGLGTGIAGCVLPGMLQDSITYAQWQSGKDVLGMGNAAYSFCNKLGGSVGTIIFGWVLEFSRFDGTLSVQPDSAIGAINILYIWVPFAAMALSLVCMWFYDLDNKYAQVEAELKERMGIARETDV